jgi:hypothetical protein
VCDLDAGTVPVLPRPPLHLLIPAPCGSPACITCRRRVGIMTCMMCGSCPMAAPAPMPAYRGAHWKHLHTLPCSTGSRSPAPTATLAGARGGRRMCTLLQPMGSRSPAPIATPPGARRKLHNSTCPSPTGTRAPAPTSGHPGALSKPRIYTSTYPTDNRAPVPTAAPPDARPVRVVRVFSSHGHSCSRTHLNTSRCPTRAAEHK